MRSWVIGTRADCDVVVESLLVSARHCQLTQIPEGFLLEDLGSTNGTFVDGVRISSPTRVTPGESITLGKTLLLPWPPGVVTYVRIGRLPDNDIVVDDPRVSGRHARLIKVDGADAMIEDVGSSNGTFLNSVDRRVTSPARLTETDTVYFGTMAVPAARLLGGRIESPAPEPPSRTSAEEEPRPAPAAAVPAFASLGANGWTAAALAQVPIIAILIVLAFGSQASSAITASSWASVGQGVASVAFALALAAVWLGFSLALGEIAAGRSPGHRGGADLAKEIASRGLRSLGLAGLACAILLAIVYWGSGLKGPWLAMWGVLVMAALLGLLLGLAVTSCVPKGAVAAVSLACFGCMIALGGWIWPLPVMNPPIRRATAAMPTRWAFEALLLLETEGNPRTSIPQRPDSTQGLDFAEKFFPVASERMGPRADALALGSMLIGLAALVVTIWGPGFHRSDSSGQSVHF